MDIRRATSRAAALTVLALSPALALAHTGVGATGGLVHGFMHPIGGLDHILAMLGVGLVAANLGGRALWLVPASFVAMMAVGGGLGVAGMPLPFLEIGIALSVVVLGALIAAQVALPVAAAMAVVGFFAVFHGHAHGAEMPATASGLAYGAGFMGATALLHAAGIGLATGVTRIGQAVGRNSVRVAGAAMSVAGIVILVQAV
ncbi:HupE/UreJ family protein [Arhodomonas sp. AD133]|uniref:HupE/UreJ family protein n=1 Tax=Arhodomonas sp. AD133 TaxID=3415009 RepID=UPI003EBFEA36